MVKKRRRILKKPEKKHLLGNYKVLLGIISIVLLFVIFKVFFVHRFFDNNDKLNLAVSEKNGDVSLLIFDNRRSEITRIILPADILVDVSRNLGSWKLKSLWKLGENEGLGGKLMTETITRHFKFPVYIWADSEAMGFIGGSLKSCSEAAVSIYKTNLSEGDKLSLGMLCLKVKNVDKSEINLENTQFIKKQVLPDGEQGYKLSGLDSPKLYSNFSDDIFSEGSVKVQIVDQGGDPSVAKKVAEILEVMGSRVVSITKGDSRDFYCEVLSGDKDKTEKIALLLGCKQIKKDLPDNFDIEIKLGQQFSQNF